MLGPISDNVKHHLDVSTSQKQFSEAAQWPCTVRKCVNRDQCCPESQKPGCQSVRSDANFQSFIDRESNTPQWLVRSHACGNKLNDIFVK